VDNQKTLDIVSTLKCLLCFGVVCIHSTFNNESIGVNNGDISLFSDFSSVFIYGFLDKTCVLVFFLISGYLFFYNAPDFDTEVYKRKIKSRVRSLLIPYVLANGLYIIVNLIWRREEMSVSWLINAWTGISGYPADPPLWYIRDLIVFALFSYVFYWIIRKFQLLVPLFLLVVWIAVPFFVDADISLFRGLVFFLLGAYLSINKYDLLSYMRINSYGWYYIISYVLLFLVSIALKNEPLSRLASVAGVLFWFSLAYKFYSRMQIRFPQLILAGSVFIYLYHYYVAISIPRYMMLTWGVSPIKAFVYYGLGAALTIFGLLGLFLLIQKYFKKLTSIIVGYRL